MFATEKIGTERRRSQRIALSVPINIASLAPLLFSGRCNTVEVSFHGCQFFLSRPFKQGTQLRLDILDTQHTATAQVVRSISGMPDMQAKIWKICVELDDPGNVWGIASPPLDWAY